MYSLRSPISKRRTALSCSLFLFGFEAKNLPARTLIDLPLCWIRRVKRRNSASKLSPFFLFTSISDTKFYFTLLSGWPDGSTGQKDCKGRIRCMLAPLNHHSFNMHDGMCKCPHHKMGPLFLTLIGLVFLLQALEVVTATFTATAWPVLLMLIGLQKMMGGMCTCCGAKK